jgi:hypothetical protein
MTCEATMKNRLPLLLVLSAMALTALAALERFESEPVPAPAPEPPCPGPICPRPKPKPRPWGKRFPLPVGSLASATLGGEIGPDGTELQCPLPGEFHTKNTGGSDGAGLCVYCSMKHAGIWQDDPVFAGLFDWMRHHPGGGYPAKVDQMIEQFRQERSLPKPDYIQVEGTDLEILKTACRSGRMPCVTYSFSPTGRYGGHRIAHMVNLVHAEDKYFVILDNNYPGASNYEWLSPEEFKKTYTGERSGWAIIPLRPGPPLPPHNESE